MESSPSSSMRPVRGRGRRLAAVGVGIVLLAAAMSGVALRLVARAGSSAHPHGSAIMIKRPGATPMPIIDFTHRNGHPSWSPDGSEIVFVRSSGDRSHLYTVRASGRRITPITSGPYVDTQPAWSPEGSRIAFASDRG